MSILQATITHPEFMPVLQVRHTSSIIYPVYIGTARRKPKSITHENRRKAYSGTVTAGAKKRITRTIDLLLQKSSRKIIYNPVTGRHMPFTLSFITLTISDPRNRTHQEAYSSCLKPFLQWMRRRGVKDYIWKAELQKRGQIHYHITTNTFINYQDIRKQWNRLQARAGYMNEYRKTHGHIDANSTDVHSVKHVRNIQAYLTKYLMKGVSKDQPQAAIKGKVWGSSESLQGSFFSTAFTPELNEHMRPYIAWKQVKETDHCYIIPQNLRHKLPAYERHQYLNHIR